MCCSKKTHRSLSSLHEYFYLIPVSHSFCLLTMITHYFGVADHASIKSPFSTLCDSQLEHSATLGCPNLCHFSSEDLTITVSINFLQPHLLQHFIVLNHSLNPSSEHTSLLEIQQPLQALYSPSQHPFPRSFGLVLVAAICCARRRQPPTSWRLGTSSSLTMHHLTLMEFSRPAAQIICSAMSTVAAPGGGRGQW